MVKGNGNGNGNGHGVTDAAPSAGVGVGAASKTATGVRDALGSKDGMSVEITDLVECSVLVMFLIQKLGKCTASEVAAKALEIGAIINIHLLDQAGEALRNRKLISYARGRRSSSEAVRMWVPRNAQWAAGVEVAHFTDLMPALVATEDAKKLMATLNENESSGDGEAKAKRALVIAGYCDIKVTFETLDELLGSQPASPMLDDLVKASTPYIDAPEECDLRFWRSGDGKALLIASDAIRGWLRTGLRGATEKGITESLAGYIGVTAARIVPTSVVQAAFPVIDQRTRDGKGLNTHECLPPGQTFSLIFSVPTRGFMESIDFVKWLAVYGPNPIRGISPARGGRFGRVAVVGYEILSKAEMTTPVARLASARDSPGMSDKARAVIDKLIAASTEAKA